jgi:hypothetical protein
MQLQNRPEKKFASIMLIITIATWLLTPVSPVCFADDAYKQGAPLDRHRSRKEKERRAIRKLHQKELEEKSRKDTSRDTSLVDHKIPTSTVKITDQKISDQKYWAFEMTRERAEAKLSKEKVVGPVRPVSDRRVRSRKYLEEKERRNTFFQVDLLDGEE